MSEYVVVKTHNFDSETNATKFTNYRKATVYLHWCWEQYYHNEIAQDTDLDRALCYHESEYARVEWNDGDYTEFNLIEILPPHDNFPTDWERYVCE